MDCKLKSEYKINADVYGIEIPRVTIYNNGDKSLIFKTEDNESLLVASDFATRMTGGKIEDMEILDSRDNQVFVMNGCHIAQQREDTFTVTWEDAFDKNDNYIDTVNRVDDEDEGDYVPVNDDEEEGYAVQDTNGSNDNWADELDDNMFKQPAESVPATKAKGVSADDIKAQIRKREEALVKEIDNIKAMKFKFIMDFISENKAWHSIMDYKPGPSTRFIMCIDDDGHFHSGSASEVFQNVKNIVGWMSADPII